MKLNRREIGFIRRLSLVGSVGVLLAALGMEQAGAASASTISTTIVGVEVATGAPIVGIGPCSTCTSGFTMNGTAIGHNPTMGSFTLVESDFTGCSSAPNGCQGLSVFTLTLRDKSGDSFTAQSHDTLMSSVSTSITLYVMSANGSYAGLVAHVATLTGVLVSNAVNVAVMAVNVS
jgi:hypothetical protein